MAIASGVIIFHYNPEAIWATYRKILRAHFCTGLHDPAYNNVIPNKRVECFCDSFGHICIIRIEAGDTIFTNEAHQGVLYPI